MEKYRAILKLHFLWFLILHLVATGIFILSNVTSLALTIKICSYPVIFIINLPFTRKYDYYFRNLGAHPLKLFAMISLADLALFVIFIFLFKLIS